MIRKNILITFLQSSINIKMSIGKKTSFDMVTKSFIINKFGEAFRRTTENHFKQLMPFSFNVQQ